MWELSLGAMKIHSSVLNAVRAVFLGWTAAGNCFWEISLLSLRMFISKVSGGIIKRKDMDQLGLGFARGQLMSPKPPLNPKP